MAKQKSVISLLPQGGMDARSPSGPQWVRNLWRPERTVPLVVRSGFGQRTQIDSTVGLPVSTTTKEPEGGYKEHLGSYLYRSNFGHRQVVSIFRADCSISDARFDEMDDPTLPGNSQHTTRHGFKQGLVAEIYDITTGRSWEELLTFKSSEVTEPEGIPSAMAHFETTRSNDWLGFRSISGVASFAQVSDTLYFCAPGMGIWAYNGIDIPNERRSNRLNADNPDGRYANGLTHSTNNHAQGMAEGSVFTRVVTVRGINGQDVAYLEKNDAPMPVGIATLGGRIAYATGNVIWFSDVGQAGSIMADNFAAFQSDGRATALASYHDTLFVFTDTEAHAFVLQHGNVAGATTPGVINISGVTTNNKAGCISQNSLVETPYGVCYVSSWGVHIIAEPHKMQTISESIASHWSSGLVDPLQSFTQADGATHNFRQIPMLFRHEGAPSVSYDVSSDTLFVAYESHLISYDFTDGGWSVWPLGVRTNTQGQAPYYELVGKALEVLSDDQGTYLLTGLYDTDKTDYENTAKEPASYSLLQLGLGGARDRTIEGEDDREWSKGRFTIDVPAEAFAGGPPAAHSNNWLLYVTPTRQWRSGDNSYYEYQVDFQVFETRLYPDTSLRFRIRSGALVSNGFTFDQARTGSLPEGVRFNQMTVLYPSARELSITTPLPGVTNRAPTRLPILRFTLVGSSASASSPDIIVLAAEGEETSVLQTMPCIVWQQQGLYNQKNIRWSGSVESFDGATEHERDVEWAFHTGMIGLGDGAVHRLRGIRSVLESSGQDDTAAGVFTGIYNAASAPDHKGLSMQRQDLEDPYVALAEIRKKALLKERISGGTRAFGGVAKWAPAAAADVDYLVDAPEVNELDISTSSKGESLAVAVFGRMTKAASYLRLHGVKAVLQSYGGSRRRGN